MKKKGKFQKIFSRFWWVLVLFLSYFLIYFSGLPELVSRIAAWLLLFFLLPAGIFSWYGWKLIGEIKSGKRSSVLEDKNLKYVSPARRKWNLFFGFLLIVLITCVYAVPVADDVWGLCTSNEKVQEKVTNFSDVHIAAGGLYFFYQSVQIPGFDKKFYLLYFLEPCQVDKTYDVTYLENSHIVISLREVPRD